jgi:putative transposase
MKKSRFTEEQTTYALRQADSGKPVGLYAGRLGVPEAPFYTWKKKYADLGVSELRKLKLLEDENVRLGNSHEICVRWRFPSPDKALRRLGANQGSVLNVFRPPAPRSSDDWTLRSRSIKIPTLS